MVNYQNGKIYKIVCNITSKQYFGSTCKKYLSDRLCQHRYRFRVNNNMTSSKVLEGGNYSIILVENYPCNSKDELHKRERYYIDNNECVNKITPLRTSSEYYNENKNVINEKRKQKILCKCGTEFRKADKARHEKSKKHINYTDEN